MTLPQQARLRAAVLQATGEAARHSEEALRNAMYNRITASDKRCSKAIKALLTAQAAIEQWRRIR